MQGLTPRSSGAPTAGHQGPPAGTVYIFCRRALASCRWLPLSSNVRRHMAIVRVYCDTGGWTDRLGDLERTGLITVHQFKYENRSRRITHGAIPSALTYDDTPKYTYNDLRKDKFLSAASSKLLAGVNSKLPEIVAVVGGGRDIDARHLDSAYMTGCLAFLTSDRADILSKRDQLLSITGLRVFHATDDWLEFERFVQSHA